MFFLILFTVFGSFSSFSFDRYQVVSQVDGERVFAMDVENYAESFIISSGVESILKIKAGEEGSSYEIEKKKLIDSVFLSIIEKMTIVRILQKDAIQKKKRQYFSLTTQQLDSLVDQQISKISHSFKKDGSTNLEAKQDLLNKLRQNQKQSHLYSNSELWQKFKDKIKFNIVERYREQEAMRYLCSLGSCEIESPMKIFIKNSKRFKRSHFVSFSIDEHVIVKNDEAIDHLSRHSLDLDNLPSEEAPENSRPRRFLFLGEIVSNRVEFRHINDWDLTSGLAPMLFGYPRTDDQGRTSGLSFSYAARGTRGSLSIELENFLFSREISKSDHLTSQEIEEDSSLRIVSRQFLDEAGKKWILLGVSAGHRTQTAGIHSFIQTAFHTLNPKTSDREFLNRDQTSLFVHGLIGVGGKYSILDSKHVDLVVSGEAFISPTVGLNHRNSFTARSSIDLNFSGAYEEYPIFSIGIFGEYSFLINGTHESVLGGKVSLGKVYRSVYYQASLFVVKWDKDLDRAYEGAPSWTTGISLSATFINQRPKVEFVLN
jgi:hypothetical protein